jgi:hypothetical protein
MTRRIWKTVFGTLVLSASHLASAAVIKGVVLSQGEPSQRWTTITPDPTQAPIKICKGGRDTELVQLTGAVVEVTGTERKAHGKNPECFFSESYNLLEIAPGRPAIIGVLTKIDQQNYAIIHESGKKWTLAKIPPGMKDLVKLKVACDLVATSAPDGQTIWLVARAYGLPQS